MEIDFFLIFILSGPFVFPADQVQVYCLHKFGQCETTAREPFVIFNFSHLLKSEFIREIFVWFSF